MEGCIPLFSCVALSWCPIFEKCILKKLHVLGKPLFWEHATKSGFPSKDVDATLGGRLLQTNVSLEQQCARS